jgi:hypothetical protein
MIQCEGGHDEARMAGEVGPPSSFEPLHELRLGRRVITTRRLSRRSGVSREGGPPVRLKSLQPDVPFRIANSAYKARGLTKSFRFRDGLLHACCRRLDGVEKRIVYIIRSDSDASRHYVGITSDVGDRLDWHNYGPSGHTVSYPPMVACGLDGIPHRKGGPSL